MKTPARPALFVFDAAIRRGFQACLDAHALATGAKCNPRTLAKAAGRPPSAASSLYAWLNGRSGISITALGEWLAVLDLTPENFFSQCLAVTAREAYKENSHSTRKLVRDAAVPQTFARADVLAVVLDLIDLAAAQRGPVAVAPDSPPGRVRDHGRRRRRAE